MAEETAKRDILRRDSFCGGVVPPGPGDKQCMGQLSLAVIFMSWV